MSTMTMTKTSRDERRASRRTDPDRLPFGKLVAWAGAGLSAGANFIVLGYLTLYATDTLGMSPATIGAIIAIGTAANAVCGLIAAWVVDRSPETRWGKARPYELAVPLLWLATGLLFAVPSSFDGAAQVAWVAAMFLFIKAICASLLGANDVLYMARAFPTRVVYAKVQTRAGMITALGAVAVSTSLPILLNMVGKSPEGWTTVMAGFSVVLGIVGLSRGIFVKEKYPTEVGAEPVKVADMVTALRSNKWIWALAGLQLAAQSIIGANVAGYYYRYVVGNLALQALTPAIGILLLPLLLFVPRIMRKFAVSQIVLFGATFGVLGGVLNLIAGANVPLLVVGGLFTGLGALPVAYLMVVMVLDLATYNESLGNRRLESTLGAIVNIFGSIGAALAAATVGAIMSSSGYDGSQATQSDSATLAIRLMFGLSFVIGFVIIATCMLIFSRFERRVLPAAQAQVGEQRQSHQPATAVAVDADADGILEPDEIPIPPLTTSAQGMPMHADLAHAAGAELPVEEERPRPGTTDDDHS